MELMSSVVPHYRFSDPKPFKVTLHREGRFTVTPCVTDTVDDVDSLLQLFSLTRGTSIHRSVDVFVVVPDSISLYVPDDLS